jgi:hypothetical protein
MQAQLSGEEKLEGLQAGLAARAEAARRANLYVLSGLLVMMAVFAIGVWSWVSFYRASGGATGLFTQTDFPAVTIASRLVSEGRGAELYKLDVQLEGQRRLISEGYIELSPDAGLKYPYPYTPPIAVLMSPLSGLPPNVGMAMWDIVNIGCMAWGLWFLLSTLPLARFTRLMILLGTLTSFPFIVNLEQGQSSGVVMLALGVGIGLLKKGRDLPAGLALGLLVLKVQWLPILVLVLIWKMRWRTLVGAVATGGALLLVSVLAAGVGWIPDYVQLLGRAQEYARELLLDPWYSHSFPGGLTALIGRGTDDIVRTANLVLMVGLVVLLLFLWRGRWEPSTRRWDGLMAATLLVAFFTNLQLNTHDLSLLALPGALGLSFLGGLAINARLKAAWLGALWTLYVATGLFLPQVFALPIRITTLAMGVMLAVLFFSVLQSEGVRKSPAAAEAPLH